MKKIVLIAAMLFGLGFTANAQMVGATNSQPTPRESRTDNSPLYRPTDRSLRFSIGAPQIFTVSYNHYLTSYFMIGGGLGFGMQNGEERAYRPGYQRSRYYWDDEYSSIYSIISPALPVFVEMDVRTPKYKWSLFLNMKIGLNLFGATDSYEKWEDKTDYYGDPVYATLSYDYNKFLFSAAVGASYKNLNLGFGVSNVGSMGNLNLFISYNLPFTTIDKWLTSIDNLLFH